MKKILSLLCCLSLFMATLTVGYAKTDEPLTQELEKAILTAKSKIDVPTEYSEFEYEFVSETAYNNAYWRLSWNKPDVYEGINILIDNSGNIISYYLNKRKDDNAKPVYLKEELKPNADKFIEKIAYDIFDNLKYIDTSFDGFYSGTYTYNYVRTENNILMPDNTVSVSVNYETGEIKSAEISWLYNVDIPDATFNVDSSKAAELVGEKLKMNLVYRNSYGKDENEKTRAYLVYIPDKSYISADAKSGEVYLSRNEWIDKAYENSKLSADFDSISNSVNESAGLTEQEIEKIDILSSLISKQQAIDAVTNEKVLLLDENLTTFNAKLSKAYSSKEGEDNYYWRVSLSDDRKTNYESGDTYRAYANATVDAKTGEIISFSSSVKRNYNTSKEELNSLEVKYNKEECKETLENFLNSKIPEKLKNSKLSENSGDYVLKYVNELPVYGGYSYNYNRINEGIEYTYNSIRGSVDGVTGKIYRFNYTWNDDIEFESPENAMTPEEAYNNYISKEGFNLIYEINNKHLYNSLSEYKYQDYELEKEVRLVYRPDIAPDSISPFTGEQLDYNGEVYVKFEPYSYKDIEGHYAERFIKLAADMQIGPDGEYFKPDENITVKEFAKLLESLTYYYNSEDTESEDSLLTKAQAIKKIITSAGLKKVAELKGIYKVDFADSNEITDDYLGYVALAKGFGIINADNYNYLKPNNNLTRAEAICMIMNYISVK